MDFQCMGIDLKHTAFSGSCPEDTVIKLYQVEDTERRNLLRAGVRFLLVDQE